MPSTPLRRPSQHPDRVKEYALKKLINDPADVVAEALLGVAAAHPELRVDHEHKIVYRGDAPVTGKVGLISGGGSGHEPLHGGFVGLGMLTRPARARSSPRRCPTRCWRPPATSTAARACCTS